MINYTERISLLMQDIVRRTPLLSFIDLSEVLVFARFGRSDAEGPFATCHCLTLPESEPGYFFWRDRNTGELTRRSEWFVTKSPIVRIGPATIKYLISFVLPRYTDQSLERSRKAEFYPDAPGWIAKLDTIFHELYHIDPDSLRSHGPRFYEEVAQMVSDYLGSNPDPELFEFLKGDFSELDRRFGGVSATTFRNFPSFPQRYMEPLEMPTQDLTVRVERIKRLSQPAIYTEKDLHVRQFTDARARRLPRRPHVAA
jgi:hypothetical protein